MANFDDILHEINEFGPYQKLRYFLICLAAMLPGIVTYIHSFMAARPDFMCDQKEFESNVTYSNVTYEKCHYILDNSPKQPCNSWKFDKTYYQSTLTEEWSMVCDRSFYRENVQAVYFSGYIVGSLLLGWLADIYGRRPIMLSSFIIIILGALGVALGPQESFGFSISFTIYAISRFLIASGTRGINDTGYILALEIVGPSHRAFAAMIFTTFFALGQMFLVLFAYFIRDWRTLGMVMVILLIPFLGYFFILAESPRWLISKNRSEEAFAILNNIAKTNKTSINESSWKMFLSETECNKDIPNETFADLMKSPKLVILTFALFFSWIVNNLAFYGVGLKANDLGVNPYLTFFISALVELISLLIFSVAIQKFGRKIPYTGCLLVAAASLLTIYFIDGNVIATVTLAMIGKFAISASYAIIHLYSSEIFPTTMRGLGQGACSMMARIGSILAPTINSLDDKYKGLPFLIFGAAALAAAVVAIILPETLNRKLPKNLEEAENLKEMKCIKNTYYKKDSELLEK